MKKGGFEGSFLLFSLLLAPKPPKLPNVAGNVVPSLLRLLDSPPCCPSVSGPLGVFLEGCEEVLATNDPVEVFMIWAAESDRLLG